MELIEDERLELLELAASHKGLTSIASLDYESLQNLDSFRGKYTFTFYQLLWFIDSIYFVTLFIY